MRVPPHVLEIVEESYGQPLDENLNPISHEQAVAEGFCIVVNRVYLDGKELHLPFDAEIKLEFSPNDLLVAWVPLIVDRVVAERRVPRERSEPSEG